MFHAGHDIAENVTGPDTRASRAALYRYNEDSAVIYSKGTIWIQMPFTVCLEARSSIASVTASAPRKDELNGAACAGTANPSCHHFARRSRHVG